MFYKIQMFFKKSEKRKYIKNRINYLMKRYGYSKEEAKRKAIAGWEQKNDKMP